MSPRAALRALLAAPVGAGLGYWATAFLPDAITRLAFSPWAMPQLWTTVWVPAVLAATVAARGTRWRLAVVRAPSAR